MDLVKHLEGSIWTIELEHALEVFSLSTYLNWIDRDFKAEVEDERWGLDDIPERFLHYLECKVSNPCSHSKFQL